MGYAEAEKGDNLNINYLNWCKFIIIHSIKCLAVGYDRGLANKF